MLFGHSSRQVDLKNSSVRLSRTLQQLVMRIDIMQSHVNTDNFGLGTESEGISEGTLTDAHTCKCTTQTRALSRTNFAAHKQMILNVKINNYKSK